MSPLFPRLALLGLVLAGTSACVTASEATPSRPPETSSALPVGEIKPPPAGCLSLTFFAPDDDRRVVRNARGRITDVLTAKGGKEPVIARISWAELEELVPRVAEIVAAGDPEPLSHIPAFYAQGHMPGPAAWAYLKRFVRETDEFWSYGDVETGLLVIREGRLLCLMAIKVPFTD